MTFRRLDHPAPCGLIPARRALTWAVLWIVLSFAGVPAVIGAEPGAGDEAWVTIDYGPLVDRRTPTHSGESVGQVLDRWTVQPGAAGDAPALLEPLLEPYAFVLHDALDALEPGAEAETPWIEVGWLYEPGEAAPAWAELLRARRAIVESDGAGRVRVFAPVPAPVPGDAGAEAAPAGKAARAAWEAHRGWLRHVLAAEARRLGASGKGSADLSVRVYPFRHDMVRTRFLLGLAPYVPEGDPTAPVGDRPPLDFEALEAFLAEGLEIEGGRLDGGQLRLIGSRAARHPTLLGEPVSLADLAVAYRAVFHGGAANAYMSLDRGFAPHRSLVSYGGRLADTRLGMVTLLCDVRFKTFSQGVDPASGSDVRAAIRREAPGFLTHIERYASHPERASGSGQQTRLWFYPDDVRMLVDPGAGMMALASPRMAAAAERVALSGRSAGEGEPPWTRELTASINADYDALARVFPELAELDRVVRLLGLFSWLQFAGEQGLVLPDLDALLAVELPAVSTPRHYPQLLAFDAFPARPGKGRVDVFERADVMEGLDRLMPAGDEPLPAVSRLFRAMTALDRDNPRHAELLGEITSVSPATLTESGMDALAYRAERLRMHQLVSDSLPGEFRNAIRTRQASGEEVGVLSIAIGGLDLGLETVIGRGAESSGTLALFGGVGNSPGPAAGLSARGEGRAAPQPARVTLPREAWRANPAGLPEITLPSRDGGRVLVSASAAGAGGRTVTVAHQPHSPDVRVRLAGYGAGGTLDRIVRREGGRHLEYALRREAGGFAATPLDSRPFTPSPVAERLAADPPQGLATLALSRAGRAAGDGSGSTTVRLHGRAPGRDPMARDLPRSAVQALLLGRDLEPRSAGRTFSEVVQLSGGEAAVDSVMIFEDAGYLGARWDTRRPPRPGEEEPLRFARALTEAARRSASAVPRGVVGFDPTGSVSRWEAALGRMGTPVLWLPEAGFAGRQTALAAELAGAWSGRVVTAERLEAGAAGDDLVVLVSAEPPGRLSRRLLAAVEEGSLAGRRVAVYSLAGELRRDVAYQLVESGELACLGLAHGTAANLRPVTEDIERFSRSLESLAESEVRPEETDSPFVWIY